MDESIKQHFAKAAGVHAKEGDMSPVLLDPIRVLDLMAAQGTEFRPWADFSWRGVMPAATARVLRDPHNWAAQALGESAGVRLSYSTATATAWTAEQVAEMQRAARRTCNCGELAQGHNTLGDAGCGACLRLRRLGARTTRRSAVRARAGRRRHSPT